jgi:hypothetical protein
MKANWSGGVSDEVIYPALMDASTAASNSIILEVLL